MKSHEGRQSRADPLPNRGYVSVLHAERSGGGMVRLVSVDQDAAGEIGFFIRTSGTGVPPAACSTCSMGTNPAALYSG